MEPEEVIEINADESAKSEFIPVFSCADVDEPRGEQCPSNEAKEGDLTDADRNESQQKSQAGDDLRTIAQRVNHHEGRDREHQHKVNRLGIKNLHCGDMMDREGHEEGERPSATDGCTSEDAIFRAAFKQKASTEDRKAEREADSALTRRTESAKLIAEKESKADDESHNAKFVEPVL